MGGVTGAIGGVVGGLTGGIQGGISKAGPQAYKGTERPINEEAYKIGNVGNIYTGATQQTQRAFDDANKQRQLAAQAQSQQQQSRAQTLSSLNQAGQARGQQQSFIQQLQQQAAGQGPSLATATLRQAQDRSLRQQLAAAAAQRGGNQAALQRALAYSQQAGNAETAQQAAQARIQEQLNARQQLAGALETQRSQDLSTTDRLASVRGQDITTAEQAAQAQLAQQGLENQGLTTGYNTNLGQQRALADLESLKTQQSLAVQGLTASGVQSQQAASAAITGGLLGGTGAALGAFSDKKMKTNIKSASSYSSEDMKTKKENEMSKMRSGQGEHDKKLESDANEKEQKKNKAKAGIGSAISGAFQGQADAYNQGASRSRDVYEKAVSSISDKSKKESMSKSDKEFSPKSFLDALKAYSFEYKNDSKNLDGAGNGRYLGVMAQDLEKAGPVGKSMVQETNEGKKVDFGKGFGAMLASQADLNSRLSQIEEGYGKVLKAKSKSSSKKS